MPENESPTPTTYPTEVELDESYSHGSRTFAELERIRWTVRDCVAAEVPPTLAEIGLVAVAASDWSGLADDICSEAERLRALVIKMDQARVEAEGRA